MSLKMETEYCEQCNAELDAGQIGLCDECQELHCGAKKQPESSEVKRQRDLDWECVTEATIRTLKR